MIFCKLLQLLIRAIYGNVPLWKNIYDAYVLDPCPWLSRCRIRPHKFLPRQTVHHFSCSWPNKTKCSAEDFKRIKTDYGICYAININQHNPFSTASAGMWLVNLFRVIISSEYKPMGL